MVSYHVHPCLKRRRGPRADTSASENPLHGHPFCGREGDSTGAPFGSQPSLAGETP